MDPNGHPHPWIKLSDMTPEEHAALLAFVSEIVLLQDTDEDELGPCTLRHMRKFAEIKLKVERDRADKLQKFKDWVHTYLDTHGVPHHPPGTHGAAGCRIGDRMDWLMAERDELRARLNEIVEMVESEAHMFRNGAERIGHGQSYTLAVADAMKDLSERIAAIHGTTQGGG